MQSQKGSNKSQQDKPRLPWGLGSAALKGNVFWLVFRDPAGKVRYENSYTADAAEAERILAAKALPRARAMVAALEKLANEGATKSKKTGGRK